MPGPHTFKEKKGKQYDHEHLMHSTKGNMKHGGLEHHESGEDNYKHPHDRSHSDCKKK